MYCRLQPIVKTSVTQVNWIWHWEEENVGNIVKEMAAANIE